ncbi:MAG: hypothetical protein V7765_21190 [Oleispira sp.]
MKLLILITFLTLTGCASLPSTGIGPKGIKLDHGLIVASTISNIDALNVYNEDWTEVIVYSIPETEDEESKIYSLKKYPQENSGKSYYYGQVPTGRYTFGLLYSYYNNGSVSSWMRMPAGSASFSFSVSDYMVNDLGLFIYQPLHLDKRSHNRSDDKKLHQGFVVREDFDNSHFARKIEAEYNLDPFEYNDTPFPEITTPLNKRLAKLSKKYFWKTDFIRLSNNPSEIIAIGKLGQYAIKQGSTWTTYSIPSNDEILDISYINKLYYISTNKGITYSSPSLNRQNNTFDTIEFKQPTLWIGGYDDVLYSLTKDEQYTYCYLKRKNEDWKEIGRFEKNFRLGSDPVTTAIIDDQGQLQVLLDGEMYRYNKTWVKFHSEDFEKVHQQNDEIFSAIVDGALIDDYIWISKNKGRDWKSFPRDFHRSNRRLSNSPPLLTDDGRVISLGNIYYIKNNKKSKSKTLSEETILMQVPYNSKEDTKTTDWKSFSKITPGCNYLASSISTLQKIYLICDDGKVTFSIDQGQTWEIETDISKSDITAEYDTILNDFLEKEKEKEKEK